MAEIFCRELLQTSNVVPPSDTQDRVCIICLGETGMMSPETGVVELLVRLPCEHVFGSGCIAIWFKENNSCPLCRRVFFPAHQEQDLEDVDVQRQDDDEQEEEDWVDPDEEEQTEDMLLRNCRIYSDQLRLDSTTIRIAQTITKLGWRIYPFCDLIHTICDGNAVQLIGLAIYLASRFTNQPRSPREICTVRDIDGQSIGEKYGVDGDDIRRSYHAVFRQRGRLINHDDIIEIFEGHDRDWPSIDPNHESDDYIESSRDLPAVRARCAYDCAYLQAPPLTVVLAEHIAANVVRAGFHLFSHPENSKRLSESEIGGVSIYIASHLMGQPLSRRSLQLRVGNAYPDIRASCIMVRDKCNPLVGDGFCATHGVHLSWESLEADIGEESPDGRGGNPDEEDGTRMDVSSGLTRTQRLLTLCYIYCSELGFDLHRTALIAQRLSEKFGSCERFDGRRLESIAAACVYMACFCTNSFYSYYSELVAEADVSFGSLYTTHLMMAQEIVLGRVDVQDIAESTRVEHRRLRHTLLPVTFEFE